MPHQCFSTFQRWDQVIVFASHNSWLVSLGESWPETWDFLVACRTVTWLHLCYFLNSYSVHPVPLSLIRFPLLNFNSHGISAYYSIYFTYFISFIHLAECIEVKKETTLVENHELTTKHPPSYPFLLSASYPAFPSFGLCRHLQAERWNFL